MYQLHCKFERGSYGPWTLSEVRVTCPMFGLDFESRYARMLDGYQIPFHVQWTCFLSVALFATLSGESYVTG